MLKTLGAIVCVTLLPGLNAAYASPTVNCPVDKSHTFVWTSPDEMGKLHEFFSTKTTALNGDSLNVETFGGAVLVKAQIAGLVPEVPKEQLRAFQVAYIQEVVKLHKLNVQAGKVSWSDVMSVQNKCNGIGIPTADVAGAILTAAAGPVPTTPQSSSGEPKVINADYREGGAGYPLPTKPADAPSAGRVEVLSEQEIATLRAEMKRANADIVKAQATGDGAQATADKALSMSNANASDIEELGRQLREFEKAEAKKWSEQANRDELQDSATAMAQSDAEAAKQAAASAHATIEPMAVDVGNLKTSNATLKEEFGIFRGDFSTWKATAKELSGSLKNQPILIGGMLILFITIVAGIIYLAAVLKKQELDRLPAFQNNERPKSTINVGWGAPRPVNRENVNLEDLLAEEDTKPRKEART